MCIVIQNDAHPIRWREKKMKSTPELWPKQLLTIIIYLYLWTKYMCLKITKKAIIVTSKVTKWSRQTDTNNTKQIDCHLSYLPTITTKTITYQLTNLLIMTKINPKSMEILSFSAGTFLFYPRKNWNNQWRRQKKLNKLNHCVIM